MRFTLGKNEKLKSKKLIEQLFTEGTRIKIYPVQLIYLECEHDSEFPVKVAFSVPKKNIKLAVHRNRIKRILREVYRKNKYLFAENVQKKYVFMFIYMADKEINYANLEQCLKKLNEKFVRKINAEEHEN